MGILQAAGASADSAFRGLGILPGGDCAKLPEGLLWCSSLQGRCSHTASPAAARLTPCMSVPPLPSWATHRAAALLGVASSAGEAAPGTAPERPSPGAGPMLRCCALCVGGRCACAGGPEGAWNHPPGRQGGLQHHPGGRGGDPASRLSVPQWHLPAVPTACHRGPQPASSSRRLGHPARTWRVAGCTLPILLPQCPARDRVPEPLVTAAPAAPAAHAARAHADTGQGVLAARVLPGDLQRGQWVGPMRKRWARLGSLAQGRASHCLRGSWCRALHSCGARSQRSCSWPPPAQGLGAVAIMWPFWSALVSSCRSSTTCSTPQHRTCGYGRTRR